MTTVLDSQDSFPLIGNYYSDDYLATDVRRGVTRNRAGTRLLALTDDFLIGLHKALTRECGPAARVVLRSCGRGWGKQFAQQFEKELGTHHGRPVREFPFMLFQACLTEAFNRHGWGSLSLDFQLQERGLVVATVQGAVYAELLKQTEEPADALMAGFLAGFFSHLAGEDLDAVQTECPARGGSVSRFVLGLANRLEEADTWVQEGRSHAEVVAALERITV